MIDSTPTASGAVVDKGTTGSSQPVVEADASCEAEEAREEALTQPGDGARPVALEGEEVLAGPEDRLDALADGGEVRTVAGFVLAHRAHDEGAHLGDGGREVATRVALVADEHRAAAAAASQELKTDLAFVTLRRGQGERPGRTVGGGQKVQTKAPEEARVGGAPAVVGDVCERRALDRLAASGALHRGRIDEQQVVTGAGALRGDLLLIDSTPV